MEKNSLSQLLGDPFRSFGIKIDGKEPGQFFDDVIKQAEKILDKYTQDTEDETAEKQRADSCDKESDTEASAGTCNIKIRRKVRSGFAMKEYIQHDNITRIYVQDQPAASRSELKVLTTGLAEEIKDLYSTYLYEDVDPYANVCAGFNFTHTGFNVLFVFDTSTGDFYGFVMSKTEYGNNITTDNIDSLVDTVQKELSAQKRKPDMLWDCAKDSAVIYKYSVSGTDKPFDMYEYFRNKEQGYPVEEKTENTQNECSKDRCCGKCSSSSEEASEETDDLDLTDLYNDVFEALYKALEPYSEKLIEAEKNGKDIIGEFYEEFWDMHDDFVAKQDQDESDRTDSCRIQYKECREDLPENPDTDRTVAEQLAEKYDGLLYEDEESDCPFGGITPEDYADYLTEIIMDYIGQVLADNEEPYEVSTDLDKKNMYVSIRLGDIPELEYDLELEGISPSEIPSVVFPAVVSELKRRTGFVNVYFYDEKDDEGSPTSDVICKCQISL